MDNEYRKYAWEEDIFDGECERRWWDSQKISYNEWVDSWEESLKKNKVDKENRENKDN